jgi:hypothetical protein
MMAVDSVIWKNNVSSNGGTCVEKFIDFVWDLVCKPLLLDMIFIRVCYSIAAQVEFPEFRLMIEINALFSYQLIQRCGRSAKACSIISYGIFEVSDW